MHEWLICIFAFNNNGPNIMGRDMIDDECGWRDWNIGGMVVVVLSWGIDC